jgi:hypothetical protein
VVAVVEVPTFRKVLDTTIAVLALRYIAGGLSATVNHGDWVLKSYLPRMPSSCRPPAVWFRRIDSGRVAPDTDEITERRRS